ncbi:TPA: hypothetical protein ACGMMS_001524 [Streptococcus agalactiae]
MGDYYGKKYFGEAAKKDVEHMAKKIINVYKTRLKNNTWLSENTKAMAIKKLDNMRLMIGYPENYRTRKHLKNLTSLINVNIGK